MTGRRSSYYPVDSSVSNEYKTAADQHLHIMPSPHKDRNYSPCAVWQHVPLPHRQPAVNNVMQMAPRLSTNESPSKVLPARPAAQVLSENQQGVANLQGGDLVDNESTAGDNDPNLLPKHAAKEFKPGVQTSADELARASMLWHAHRGSSSLPSAPR